MILQVMLVLVVSYLLGAFPTAYVIARLKDVNIFEVGSGNMGGTNVARSLGTGWGILVYAIDILKGIIAIWLATVVLLPQDQPLAAVIAAIAAVVGHNWSLFVVLITGTLRGGKGAATAFGTLLMIAPLPVLVVMIIGGAVLVVVTRYVSLAVVVMIAIAVPWMLLLVRQHALDTEYLFYTVFIGGILLWRFRTNIHRLLTGTERRFGERV